MDRQKIKKTIYFILPAIVLLAIYVVGYFYMDGRWPNAKQKEVVDQKLAPLSFDVEVKKYNNAWQTALIATRQNDKNTAAMVLDQASTFWRGISNYYKDNQPTEYSKTKNWASKINDIFEQIIKATNAVQDNDLSRANDNLLSAGKILSAIRAENDKKTIGDDLLVFYENVRAVTDAPGKKEVMKILPQLKLSFTILKGYNLSPEYKRQIENLEKIIGDLDKLLPGPDFSDAKNKLEPAFNKIFLEFG